MRVSTLKCLNDTFLYLPSSRFPILKLSVFLFGLRVQLKTFIRIAVKFSSSMEQPGYLGPLTKFFVSFLPETQLWT